MKTAAIRQLTSLLRLQMRRRRKLCTLFEDEIALVMNGNTLMNFKSGTWSVVMTIFWVKTEMISEAEANNTDHGAIKAW